MSLDKAESGRNNARPALAACLSHARRARAVLLVAKADRLSRDAGFLLKLKSGQVPIVFADLPEATEIVVGVMAVVAQEEARRISQRTVDALQALRQRGVALGSARPGHWDGREEARLRGARTGAVVSAKVRRQRLLEALEDYRDLFGGMLAQGMTCEQMAQALNVDGWMQPSGGPWHKRAVARALLLLNAITTRKEGAA